MKRFHVHVHVQDIAQSAIPTRGDAVGVDYLGLQTDDAKLGRSP